eukprot:GDKJ01064488.1.p1 GENE.GDKJ01064488.1~~GDKJ01064488.1.p1  ORF type:complete len:476 (-),score=137.15 GDKJ01064488.1:80-1444(-)
MRIVNEKLSQQEKLGQEKILSLESELKKAHEEIRLIRTSSEDSKFKKEQELLDTIKQLEKRISDEKKHFENGMFEVKEKFEREKTAEVLEWKNKYKDLQGSATTSSVEMERAISNAREESNKITESVRLEGEAKLAEVQKNHETEKANLKRLLMNEHEKALDSLEKRLNEEHENVVAEVKSLHAKEVRDLKSSFGAQLMEKEVELIKKMETQESLSAVERKATEARISSVVSELSNIRSKLLEAEQSIENKQQLIATLEVKFKEAELKLEEATRASIALEQKYLNERRELFERHDETVRTMSANHAQHLVQTKEEHEIATARLERAFASERAALEEKSNLFKAKFNELQRAYENRPSREEDVAKIRAYEEDIRQKEAWLMEAKDAIQQQRLELLNRDANYTRMMFNGGNVKGSAHSGGGLGMSGMLGSSQPVMVGVLNPIEKAKERQAIARQKR